MHSCIVLSYEEDKSIYGRNTQCRRAHAPPPSLLEIVLNFVGQKGRFLHMKTLQNSEGVVKPKFVCLVLIVGEKRSPPKSPPFTQLHATRLKTSPPIESCTGFP